MPSSILRCIRIFAATFILLLNVGLTVRSESLRLSKNEITLFCFVNSSPGSSIFVDVFRANPGSKPITYAWVENRPSWLNSYYQSTPTGINFTASVSDAPSARATVTIKADGESADLIVNLVNLGARQPANFISDDRSRRVYSLFANALMATSLDTSEVLHHQILPAGLSGGAPAQSISLSTDGTELRVYFPGTSTFATFSAKSLLLQNSIVLPPPPPAYAVSRLLADERDGLLYLLCSGPPPDTSERFLLFKPFLLEVRSASDGTLRQRLPLPSYAGSASDAQNVEALTLHPTRPELWVASIGPRDASQYDLVLTHHAIAADGQVAPEFSPPHALDAQIQTFQSVGLRLGRLLFQPGGSLVAYRQWLLDQTTFAPFPYASASPLFFSPESFSADGAFLYTKEEIIALKANIGHRLVSGGAVEAVRLSNLGLHLTSQKLSANFPTSIFLPEYVMSLPNGQIRSPAENHIVHPTSHLTWNPIPEAESYRVYLALDAAALDGSDPEGLIGETQHASLDLSAPLTGPQSYFWRVDPIVNGVALRGATQSFVINRIRPQPDPILAYTVAGSESSIVEFELHTDGPSLPWRLESPVPWLSFASPTSGVGSASIRLKVDASALPSGTRTIDLSLTGPDGPSAIPITILVSDIASTTVAENDGTAFHYLISGGSDKSSHLLKVDAISGRILQSRFLSVDNGNSGYGYYSIGLPSLSERVYVGHTLQEHLLVFSTTDLASLESISLPASNNNPASHLPPAYLHAAPGGDLWIVGFRDLALLHTATGTIKTYPLPENGSRQVRLLPSKTEWQFRQILDQTNWGSPNWGYPREFAGIRSLKLTNQGWEVGPQTPLTGEYGYGSETFSATPDFSRVTFGTLLLDQQNQIISRYLPQARLLTNESHPLLVGKLILEGHDYSTARTLPSATTILCQHPPSGRFLIRRNGRLETAAINDFPPLPPVILKDLAPRSRGIAVEIHWSGIEADIGKDYYMIEAEIRKVGTHDWTYGGHLNLRPPFQFNIDGNEPILPETDYEIRARVRFYDNNHSFWSEVVTTRTKPDAPYHLSANAYSGTYHFFEDNTPLSFTTDVVGNHLEWEVKNLPPGLTFDPSTQTVSGSVRLPGVYLVDFKARNESGEFAWVAHVQVAASTLRRNTGQYHGLQIYAVDPLVGDWRVTRSGRRFTGAVRTFVGSGSFKVNFDAPDGDTTLEVNTLSRLFFTRIDGVRVNGYFQWDTVLDRVYVSLNAADVFQSGTLATSGAASPYSTTNPLPQAGRHTALLVHDFSAPSVGPAPEGIGHLRLDLTSAGISRLTGESALGQKLTASGLVDREGRLPWFLPTSGGHFWGLLQTTSEASGDPEPDPPLAGAVHWVKYDQAKSKTYPLGFEQELAVVGNHLPPVGKTRPPLLPLENPAKTAEFSLTGGGLSRLSKPINQNLTPTATGFTVARPGTPENPNRVAVKLDPATGLVTGSAAILDPLGKKVVRTLKFSGAFVKNPFADGEDVIGGYFTLPDEKGQVRSGTLQIAEPETTSTP